MEMKEKAYEHLKNKILPFWMDLKDNEFGGFYGYKGYDLVVDKKAVKGCILHSRILWFFSNCYLVLEDPKLLIYADHAYKFIKEYCIDREYGGIFWSVSYDGKSEDSSKHTYNQAFAIYALSSYYDATKNKDALSLAKELYGIIESKCRDEGGYLEAFDREFVPASNEKLSENGVMAERTMNTLLHVLEAYTELYRVSRDESIRERLEWICKIWAEKFYNPQKERQEVFFDHEYNTLIDLHSYGHDIETSWLLDRTLDVLGDEDLSKLCQPLTASLCNKIYNTAYKNHSLLNECERGVDDLKRVWWVQAEAVVGFINGHQKSSDRKMADKYLAAALDIFEMILDKLVDKREGSEWFHDLDADFNPVSEPIVEPWKCPYHNGRMCLEIIKRL